MQIISVFKVVFLVSKRNCISSGDARGLWHSTGDNARDKHTAPGLSQQPRESKPPRNGSLDDCAVLCEGWQVTAPVIPSTSFRRVCAELRALGARQPGQFISRDNPSLPGRAVPFIHGLASVKSFPIPVFNAPSLAPGAYFGFRPCALRR